MDNLLEQMANISKAHGYGILSNQVKELKEENKRMAEALKEFIELDKEPQYHGAMPVFLRSFRDKAEAALKNRKPYNL